MVQINHLDIAKSKGISLNTNYYLSSVHFPFAVISFYIKNNNKKTLNNKTKTVKCVLN